MQEPLFQDNKCSLSKLVQQGQHLLSLIAVSALSHILVRKIVFDEDQKQGDIRRPVAVLGLPKCVDPATKSNQMDGGQNGDKAHSDGVASLLNKLN